MKQYLILLFFAVFFMGIGLSNATTITTDNNFIISQKNLTFNKVNIAITELDYNLIYPTYSKHFYLVNINNMDSSDKDAILDKKNLKTKILKYADLSDFEVYEVTSKYSYFVGDVLKWDITYNNTFINTTDIKTIKTKKATYKYYILIFKTKNWKQDQFDITFNLPEGNLTLDPFISACGTLASANSTYTLTQNINSSSCTYCLLITASNVTIDGAGYNLNTSLAGSCWGINPAGANLLKDNTIKNLNIYGGTGGNGIANQYQATRFKYTNNTIAGYDYSIFDYGGWNNTYTNNYLYYSNGEINYYNIYVMGTSVGSDNVLIQNNTINDPATSGIFLSQVNTSKVINNNITIGGKCIDIYPGDYSHNHNISNNLCYNGNYGVYSSATIANTMSNININNNTFINFTYGAYLNFASNILFFNNLFINSTYGIYLNNSAQQNNFTNNTILYSQQDGIRLNAVTSKNNIFNNVVSCYNNQSAGAYFDFVNANTTIALNVTYCDTSNPANKCSYSCYKYSATPVINNLYTTPTQAVFNQAETCSFNVSSINLTDPLSVSLKWYNESTLYINCNYTPTNNNLYTTNTTCSIPINTIQTGQNWSCSINTNNSFGSATSAVTSTALNSNAVESYTSTIYEINSYNYTLIYYSNSTISTATANITWNDINYPATATINNNIATFNVTIKTPLLNATALNINHFWNYNINGLIYNTTTATQRAYYSFYPSYFATTPSSINEGGNSTNVMNVIKLLTTPVVLTTTLQWHLTNYTFPLQSNTTSLNIYNTTIIPVITGLTSVNTTGYLTIIYGNTTKTRTLTATQSITDYTIFNCTSVSANKTLNFTIYNENTPTTAISSNLSGIIYYWYLDRNSAKNISFAYTGASSYFFCLNSTTPLYVEANLEHKPNLADYSSISAHHYYLFNTLINTTMQSFSLYNMNLTSANSLFRLTILDSETLIPKLNVLTKMNRYYSGTSYLWLPVQHFLSDSFGLTLFDIFEKDKTYSFNFYDTNNCLLKQANLSFFSCTSSICEYSVMVGDCDTTITPANNTFTHYFDNSTKTYYVLWSDTTGLTKNVTLIINQEKANEVINICTQTITASSGTMFCSLSNLTGTFTIWILDSSSPTKASIMEYLTIPAINLASYIGDNEGAFWSFLLLATFICAGVMISPVASIVTSILGLIAIFWLGLWTPITLSLIVGITIIGVIIASRVKY